MKNTSTLAIKKQGMSLEVLIADEAQRRKLITQFISQHMKEGTDYGTITITGKNGREYTSKPSLFKPGSEKFCSLLHLRPTFVRDDETWEMAGKRANLFCYKCILLDQKEKVIGEGRGAADLNEKASWTINNAVKIAEKRAQIDAVLRTGGLSDFFTQDLEDAVASNGGPQKVMQKVTNIDTESTISSQKCKYCGTVGKYHKKGCPAGNPSAAEVVNKTDVGSVQDVT